MPQTKAFYKEWNVFPTVQETGKSKIKGFALGGGLLLHHSEGKEQAIEVVKGGQASPLFYSELFP